MKSMALRDGDIFAEGGRLVLAKDIDAVRIGCETAMKALRGEMIFAADAGMPYSATVWESYSPARFSAAARTVLAGVPGVVRVEVFESSRRDEQVLYEALILTEFGVASVSNSV